MSLRHLFSRTRRQPKRRTARACRCTMESLENRRVFATIDVDYTGDRFNEALVDDALTRLSNNTSIHSLELSLREAVVIANRHDGRDIIRLDHGPYNLSIRPYDYSDFTASDPTTGDLDIAGDVVIRGKTSSISPTIDAQQIDRVMQVTRGATVTLVNLKITGGNTEMLGRIHNEGGGIYNMGDLRLDSTHVTHNLAEGDAGGIFNHKGTVRLNQSRVSNNSAHTRGGGIVNYARGELTLNHSTVDGNDAEYRYGGIWNANGEVTLNSSTVNGNEGVGIYNGFSGKVTLMNSTVNDNEHGRGAGGIVNESDGEVTLVNSTVDSNDAKYGAGGIYNRGMLVMKSNSRINNNVTTDGSGGGIYNEDGGEVMLINSEVSGNTANGSGGGILSHSPNYDHAGRLTILGSQVSNNTAGGDGGGIHFDNLGFSDRLLIRDSVISANTAGGQGGGLYLKGTGATTIQATQVIGDHDSTTNEAQNGGGIYNETDLELTDVGINGHSASIHGGAIYNTQTITMTNSTIDGNRSRGNGGGIHSTGDLEVINSTISNNLADRYGGGVSNYGGRDDSLQKMELINSTISNNYSAETGGGVFNVGVLYSFNATITENVGAKAGGGVYNCYSCGSSTRLFNTIVAGNHRREQVVLKWDWATHTYYASVADDYTAAQDTRGSNNLIQAIVGSFQEGGSNLIGMQYDPGLAPLGDYGGPTKTHKLLYGSDAIDRGDQTHLPSAYRNRDQRGIRRVSARDIGAVEFGSRD